MKKSKIIVALLLAFVMVFGIVSLTACQDDKDKPLELVLWVPSGATTFYKNWANNWANGYTDADGVVHEPYTDAEGNRYKVIVTNQEESDVKTPVTSAPADAADVFCFIDDQLADLVSAGVLASLGTGTYAQEIAARNSESSVNSASYERKLADGTRDEKQMYAYPMQADNTYYLYYNSKYLDDDDVTTWEKLFAKLDQLNTGKQGTARRKLAFDYDNSWYGASWFFSFDGEFDVNAGTSNFYTEEVGAKALKAAFQFSQHHANIAFQGPDDAKEALRDEDGNVIACVAGGWIYASPDEDTPTGVDQNPYIKLTILPTFNFEGRDVRMKAFISSKLMGVNSYSPYLSAAHALANFLTDEEVQRDKALKLFAGPSNINAAADPEVAELPTVKAAADQAQYAVPQLDFNYWDAIKAAVVAVRADTTGSTYFSADGTRTTELAGLLTKLQNDMFPPAGL